MAKFILYLCLLIFSGVSLKDNHEFKFDRQLNNIPITSYQITPTTRFLVWDIYIGEGASTMRATYIKISNLVRFMIDRGEDWILVLPEWRRLYHWKTKIKQEEIPWGQYFDLQIMNTYIPVMEFDTFWNNISYIDNIIIVQRGLDRDSSYAKFDECKVKHYYREINGIIKGPFYSRKRSEEVFAKNYSCIRFCCRTVDIANFLINLTDRVIMFDRAHFLPDYYDAGQDVLKSRMLVRRSMVIAKHLQNEANQFRKEFLDSSDEIYDGSKRDKSTPPGGPYIGVHWRADDWKQIEDYVTEEKLASCIALALKETGLQKVYVATDASVDEIKHLQKLLTQDIKMYYYPKTVEKAIQYSDGGIALIDQWVVANARMFIGSFRSGFTTRIVEERTILGFPKNTTYTSIIYVLENLERKYSQRKKERHENHVSTDEIKRNNMERTSHKDL